MKLAELEALPSFRKQQKTQKLAVEEMKLEEELDKAKAMVKVIEVQEELEKGKNLSFRYKTANNMQSINQNMNVL